jgi:hypothetical protein
VREKYLLNKRLWWYLEKECCPQVTQQKALNMELACGYHRANTMVSRKLPAEDN